MRQTHPVFPVLGRKPENGYIRISPSHKPAYDVRLQGVGELSYCADFGEIMNVTSEPDSYRKSERQKHLLGKKMTYFQHTDVTVRNDLLLNLL